MQSRVCGGFPNPSFIKFSVSYIDASKEIELLGLLRQLQTILSDAINSLEIKSIKSIEARYLTWAAVTINQTARGFIVLRKTKNIETSKLLVRPIMEALLSATAVMREHGFLFRKLYTELMEEKKLPRPKPATKAEVDLVLAEYKKLFRGFDQNYPFKEQSATIRDAASGADVADLRRCLPHILQIHPRG